MYTLKFTFMKNYSYPPKGISLKRKRLRVILLALFIGFAIYLFIDYSGPKTIKLKTSEVHGINCLTANELVVQQYDKSGDLWATKGMVIYKMVDGDNKFVKVAHVPTGFSLFWIRNFSIVRDLTFRPECIEVVVSTTGEICAMSAGHLWYRSREKKKFIKTLSLAHYGIGDQGIRNDGIVNINDSTIYFGEYFRNNEISDPVRIFSSSNFGKSWEVAYEFKPGEIRHIHAIQQDPYTGNMWVCTGDWDEQVMVAWSSDSFESINPIGQDSSMWRVCQLVFTEDEIYWGTDTYTELAGLYKVSKDSMKASKIAPLKGAVFFATRLAKGTIVMSTDREGIGIEEDDNTRIIIFSDKDSLSTLVMGTWQIKEPAWLSNFATLRFQRDQGGQSLAITCVNQKEFKSGQLIIISEDDLISAK